MNHLLLETLRVSLCFSTFFLISKLPKSECNPVPSPDTLCNQDQFHCPKDNICINKEWICDGSTDCYDASDEKDCPTAETIVEPCEVGQFQCVSDKVCLNNDWVCDGSIDCMDKSDELNCADIVTCNENEVRCTDTGHCVDIKWTCDGIKDCIDGTDENNCPESEIQISSTEDDSHSDTTTDISVDKLVSLLNLVPSENEVLIDNELIDISNLTLENTDVFYPNEMEENYSVTSDYENVTSYDTTEGFNELYTEKLNDSAIDQLQIILSYNIFDKVLYKEESIPNDDIESTTESELSSTLSMSSSTIPMFSSIQSTLLSNYLGFTDETSTTPEPTTLTTDFTLAPTTTAPTTTAPTTTTSTTTTTTTTTAPTTTTTSTTTTTIPTTTPYPCDSGNFYCRYDQSCIPVEWRCDHTADCWDSSDEMNCDQVNCPVEMVQCRDTGQCIFRAWLCDGNPDCDTGSDELNC